MSRLLLPMVVAILLLPSRSTAQFDEAGVFFGVSHYSGDLTERFLEPLGFNLAWGLYVRQKHSDRFGLKFQFTKGLLTGDDANSPVESSLWRRNLSFESNIYELAAVGEYNFFRIKKGEQGISPYIYAGVAGFYFTPFAKLDNKTYDLHHHKTEGVSYSLYQFAIPFGAGVKMQINGAGCLSIIAGFRKTFTDYIDDVSTEYPNDLGMNAAEGDVGTRARLSYRSPEVITGAPLLPVAGGQRGNPDKNDWYMFFGVTLGANIK